MVQKPSPRRRKRVRVNQGKQTKITVYFYDSELEDIKQAAEKQELSLSAYMAFAAKARAKSDLSEK